MSLFNIDAKITANTSGFKNAINKAEKTANGFKNTLKGLEKTIASVFAVTKIIQFGKQCLELGSDLAEVQNVVDVTFGSMSAKVNDFAKNAAEQFGLSETSAKRYMGTLGSMATAFGFTTDQAYEMSEAMTGLVGDVASFYNLNQEESFNKLKAVFTGETEGLKSLGIVMTQTALDQYALANGFGKVTSKMNEQEKVSLRYAFVQSQLKNATGDFYRTQDGWANQTRILSLQAQSTMAKVGQGLINVLNPVLHAVNAVMKHLASLADMFSQITALFFGDAGGGGSVSTPNGGGAPALTSMADAADQAAGSLGKAKEAAEAYKNEVAGFDQITKLSDQSSSNSGSSGSDAGIDSAGGAISGFGDTAGVAEQKTGKLTGAIKALKEWIDKLDFSKLQTAWGNLTKAVKGFVDLVGEGLKWVWDNILVPLAEWTIEEYLPATIDQLAAAFELLNAVLEAMKPYADWIWKHFLKPIAKWTGRQIVSWMEKITSTLRKLTDLISGKVTFKEFIDSLDGKETIILSIGTALTTVYGAIKLFKTGEKIIDSFGTVFGAIFSPKGLIILGIMAVIAAGILLYKNWDKIKAYLIKTWENIKKFAGKAWGGIKKSIIEPVKNAVKNVKDFFGKMFTGIKDVFGKIKDWITNTATKITNAITKPFKDAKAGAVSLITGLKDKVKDIFTAIITWVKTSFQKVGDWIKAPFKAAKNFLVGEDGSGGLVGTLKRCIVGIFDGLKTAIKIPINFIIGILNGLIAGVEKVINAIPEGLKKLKEAIGFSGGGTKKLLEGLEAQGVDTSILNGKDTKVNLGRIPRLATGGITNGPVNALIGEAGREAVLPLERNTQWMDTLAAKIAGIMGSQNITVNTVLDGQIVARNTINYINRTTRTTGRNPVTV